MVVGHIGHTAPAVVFIDILLDDAKLLVCKKIFMPAHVCQHVDV